MEKVVLKKIKKELTKDAPRDCENESAMEVMMANTVWHIHRT